MTLDCIMCGATGDLVEPPFFLEAHRGEDGDQYIRFAYCCLGADELGAGYGFQEVYGVRLEDVVSELLGVEVREIYVDGTGVFRCRLASHAPGTGVKGWQAYVFSKVDEHHRHHDAPQGWKFGVSVRNGLTEVGVAIVGRPVSRMLQKKEPLTLEVTRVCTYGDPRLRRNASSKLYGACVAEARKLGATKLITYTLESEDGASLKASGFSPVATTSGGSWDRRGRRRADKAPTTPKTRWERRIR